MKTIPIKSKIKNLNIVIGCTFNCPYCYARCNAKRFSMVKDFSKPEFFENKLRLFENKSPHTFFITGMSDFADWKDEWITKVLQKIKENPQNQFVILTKRPEKIKFSTNLDNVWIGVTVTCKADLKRISDLKKNIKCKHYHITFEPLHEDVGVIDLKNIDWIVIGTETGTRKGKISAKPEWVENIVKQARENKTPIFMKEELAKIIGEKKMIQEFAPNLIQKEI